MINNPHLYEINTAVWLYELSQLHGRVITLGEVPSGEWDRLKDAGFHLIWLMGVWKRCRSDREYFLADPRNVSLCNSILPGWTEDDIIGSPYAIEEYAPDPLIGTWEDISSVREELNKRNMKLILDFVPNHTGLEHRWHLSHPQYYINVTKRQYERNPTDYYPVNHDGKVLYLANGRDPFFPPWTDTLQLNYFNPRTRLAMVEEIVRISRYCDGFRCDMAMLVLNEVFRETWGWSRGENHFDSHEEEFWSDVREALPDSILIAETYWDTEWDLQQLGFDYTYDKILYDRLELSSAPDIYLHLKADVNFQKKLTRFIENHDEPRSSEIFGKERLEAAAVLFATVPGMKLYYQGQMEGRRTRIPVQMRRVKTEEPDGEIKAFYEKLLTITKQDIFHDGEWCLRDVIPPAEGGASGLIAYTWTYDERIKLVAVNMGHSDAKGIIQLESLVSPEIAYLVHDELDGQRITLQGKDLGSPGLAVALGPFRAHVFDISRTA